mmetsp:Transcript_29773/g.33203  ORF Transcript_29773/g.33203 Transcript_29773/m.33203 type:complete len:206 (+) Transcript_29773:97-714(+)
MSLVACIGPVYIKNKHSGLVLHVRGRGRNQCVFQYKQNEKPVKNQLFKCQWLSETLTSKPSFMIVSEHTNKVLQVTGSRSSACTRLIQKYYSGVLRQLFHLEYYRGYAIIVSAYSGRVLTVPSGKKKSRFGVAHVRRRNSDNQMWSFELASSTRRIVTANDNPNYFSYTLAKNMYLYHYTIRYLTVSKCSIKNEYNEDNIVEYIN